MRHSWKGPTSKRRWIVCGENLNELLIGLNGPGFRGVQPRTSGLLWLYTQQQALCMKFSHVLVNKKLDAFNKKNMSKVKNDQVCQDTLCWRVSHLENLRYLYRKCWWWARPWLPATFSRQIVHNFSKMPCLDISPCIFDRPGPSNVATLLFLTCPVHNFLASVYFMPGPLTLSCKGPIDTWDASQSTPML